MKPYKVLIGKLKGRAHLEILRLHERKILKLFFHKGSWQERWRYFGNAITSLGVPFEERIS
jgi:hypothetical protein